MNYHQEVITKKAITAAFRIQDPELEMYVVSVGAVIGFCCHWRIKDDATKWIRDITHLNPA